ncbi:ABC transporter ATP-binding protein [Stackebrandtia nassauensis]|uniref:ABC transporter related protein n=1 Tax=Stackebrandtia nassauensis (strain DSM 44728 / CIP 108903 / NRRL B-16338 / NBRC 102104 / LLR-40K-21) TaxID=446470 RepID=D3PUC6_STANL|nr:ABC transporter ATP-binding protein [Stackebrandtia nassauensis]ADD42939.1 ABC transporter related protein [Stackebrandtia nassauensis DSM 44728]
MASSTDDREALIDPGALASFLAPVRGRLLVGVVLSGISAVVALFPFVAVAEIGRTLIEDGGAERAWTWVAIGIAAILGRTLLYGSALALCHYADADFRHHLRVRLVRHLATLPLGWFADHGSGEVKKAVADDVKNMHTIVAHYAIDLTSAIVAPLAALVYMSTVDWRFALVIVAYIAVVAAIVAPSSKRAYLTHMDDYNRAQGELGATAVELVDGIEVVKTFGEGSGLADRFHRSVDRLTEIGLLWTAAMGRPWTVMNLLFFPATMAVVICAAGSGMIGLGWIAPVEVLPFLLVGVGLPTGYLQIGQMANSLRESRLAATHLGRLMRLPGLPEPDRPQHPEGARVELDRVTFSYRDGHPVVADVSLTLEPGTVTALVGPSGSGKTTLARLISRFWDVDSGSVRVGGVDTRDLPSAELLSRVAIVFQDAVALRETVRDNIKLARPDATDTQIRAAAEAAQLHQRILQLPDGYDTVLGENGAHLSGGELQRLTIARAFLQDAPILLLDEATAHADPDAETQIQDALARLGAGRTVLVIAHRLHTVTGADQIAVLDAGRVVQLGRHDRLLSADGLYRRMWTAQHTTEGARL